MIAAAVSAAALLVGCSSNGDAKATPAPSTTTSPTATATAATTASATATPTASATTAPAAKKVSANNATQAEVAAALTAAGVPSPAQWAREVAEYRPYPADDPSFAKLRKELAKYNPAPGVVDAIIATLSLP